MEISTMVDVGTFSSIKYPEEEHVRVARLQEKFNEVADIAKQSKAQYQHFFAVLLKEQNHLSRLNKFTLSSNLSSKAFNNQSIILPPEKKKARKCNTDTTNYSLLKVHSKQRKKFK